MKKIGGRIRELRMQQGMSQKNLADAIGVREPTLSRYETGKRVQSWEILCSLADAFNTTIDYLLARTDASPPLSETFTEDVDDMKLQLYRYYICLNRYEREILRERAQTLSELPPTYSRPPALAQETQEGGARPSRTRLSARAARKR
ncbi:MAG: helix-turn-helix domain-containing protein [Clostridiales Family XIII bacterium]|jgi:transcriptional regulator with XRE-family HTH domain|nr:helix-turn-helix domain-containing protein [Clostridiales Family XIII bacterium]